MTSAQSVSEMFTVLWTVIVAIFWIATVFGLNYRLNRTNQLLEELVRRQFFLMTDDQRGQVEAGINKEQAIKKKDQTAGFIAVGAIVAVIVILWVVFYR